MIGAVFVKRTIKRLIDLLDIPTPEAGKAIGWDANGNPTNLTLGGSSSLPPQTNNSGKFLTTNGTDPAWATIDIPAALADLSSDATHRLVTDTEKSTWNGKAAGSHTHAINAVTGLQTALDGKETSGAAAAAVGAHVAASDPHSQYVLETNLPAIIGDCPDDGQIYVRRYGAWEIFEIT